MTIVYFIVILGIIVLVHELGHLISAKAFNVYCREFAIGFGPVIKKIKGKETTYSIRALPLGGFVSMAGEVGVDIEDIDPSRTLKGIHPFKRIIIMLAGVFANIMLAFAIFVVLFLLAGQINVPPEPVVAGVIPNSAAEQAGIMENDRIVKITFSDNHSIEPKDFYEIINVTQMVSDPMIFTIERGQQTFDFELTPTFSEEHNRFMLGMYLPPQQVQDIEWYEAFPIAMTTIVDSIAGVFLALSFLIRGMGLQSLSGPLGIYEVTAQQAAAGFQSLVVLTAVLSLNIGVFNLLPLPILDGGRVIMTAFEWISRKPIHPKVEQALISISMFLILALLILVTFQDITKIFG